MTESDQTDVVMEPLGSEETPRSEMSSLSEKSQMSSPHTVMTAGYYDENFNEGMLQIFNTNDRKMTKMFVALAANYACVSSDNSSGSILIIEGHNI